jgi:hypothetical protein
MELFGFSAERNSLDFSLMVEIRRSGLEIGLMERNHECYGVSIDSAGTSENSKADV